MPLAIDDPAERAVEVQCDGHATTVALHIQSRDVCVMVVVLMQGCERIDGGWVGLPVAPQHLLGCRQLRNTTAVSPYPQQQSSQKFSQ
jgi:hypothetical protein